MKNCLSVNNLSCSALWLWIYTHRHLSQPFSAHLKRQLFVITLCEVHKMCYIRIPIHTHQCSPLSCARTHRSWDERTQEKMFPLKNVFCTYFITCHSKFRWVRVKCCTTEILCSHRLYKIISNIDVCIYVGWNLWITHYHTYMYIHTHTTVWLSQCSLLHASAQGRLHPPEAMMHFPPCFRFPPYFRKILRLSGKSQKFNLSQKKFLISIRQNFWRPFF